MHGLDDYVAFCCDLDKDEANFYYVGACDDKATHNVRSTHDVCACAVFSEGSGVNAAGSSVPLIP